MDKAAREEEEADTAAAVPESLLTANNVEVAQQNPLPPPEHGDASGSPDVSPRDAPAGDFLT